MAATGALGGVEMLIWLEAARRLRCTFSVREPDVDNRYGNFSGNGSVSGGIFQFLMDGTADVGFASVWLSTMTMNVTDPAPVWAQVCVTFLVPRPRPLVGQLSALWRPLQPAVWDAVAVCLLLHAAAAALLDGSVVSWRGDERRPRRETCRRLVDAAVRRSPWALAAALLGSVAALLGQPTPHARGAARRALTAAWRLPALLLSTAFCSALVGSLAAPAYEAPLDSVADMLRHGLSWGNVYRQPLNIFLDLQKPAHAQWASRWRQERRGARARLVETGRYAVPAGALGAFVFVEGESVEAATVAGLRRIHECTCTAYVAHVFPRDSPLFAPFSSLVLRMLSSGLVELWQSRATAHTLLGLQSAFLLAAAGLSAAGAVFAAELLLAAWRRRRRQAEGRGQGPPSRRTTAPRQ
ncbi:uncharacterized protein LOC126484962 [Schistocerca serialis cubense]|uniref:uncharacterized protein LOC126484962 n=1 Tax=Schistocerca serialis cubense TaxID=2023355 RepID=UPI00214EF906|nr:uncharacterized protein LOC126484962 [Schistocerca serialis cubense]